MLKEKFFDVKYEGLAPVFVGSQTCEAHHAWGYGVRTYWLWHYVVRGCGKYVFEGQEYFVKAGEMFVIPPYCRVYYEADEQTPWQYIWVAFTASAGLPIKPEPVMRCIRAGHVFESMLSAIYMGDGAAAFVSGKLWELMGYIQEDSCRAVSYAERAKGQMDAGFMKNNFTVAGVAQALSIDRCYLYSLFRNEFGISPQQYLVKLRMEKAKELMVRYAQPPTVAANSVGYTDFANFSKMFKKYHGVSPRNCKP